MAASPDILRCPVCGEGLSRGPGAYACPRGHSFDIARQGYVNLLLPQQKHSREPGDSAAMIAGRARFLDSGAYDPVAAHLCTVVAAALPGGETGPILDAGCGEGYYLTRLRAHLAARPGAGFGPAAFGVDISRPAIRHAAGRDRAITWIVAGVGALPFGDGTMSYVLSIFAPPNFVEFHRVLAPGGRLVLLAPGPQHLYELRQAIYPDVVLHAPEKWPARAAPLFALADSTQVTYRIDLPAASLGDLLTMTPYFWHSGPDTQARVAGLAHLQTTVDVAAAVFVPVPGTAPSTLLPAP